MAEARNATPSSSSSSATPNGGEKEQGAAASSAPRRSTELARSEAGGSPFSFMRRFVSDIDRVFDDFGFGPALAPRHADAAMSRFGWAPQIDVFERGGQLVIHADLPGTRQEDVRVEVAGDVLTISGEREHAHEQETGGVYRCERSYGSFRRSIPLPEGVNPDSVNASFENGVLEVAMRMPKQGATGRVVPIQPKAAGGPTH